MEESGEFMRKIIVVEFITLDGVTQAPGGPEEDTAGGFKFGGWLAPYGDETLMEGLAITYGKPYDLLLGRKTYDIFANYWPMMTADKPGIQESDLKFANEFNSCKKYVATHSHETLKWNNSESLGSDVVSKIKQIKESGDKNLLVVGSAHFAHTLFEHDLVDDIHLFCAPIILGHGKRLFAATSMPKAWKLTRSAVSKTGLICMNYTREGEIKTGSMG